MSHHTNDVHPPKSEAIGANRGRGSEEEDNSCNHKRGTEVPDTVGKPGKEVEGSVFVGGQDVAEVGAVEDIFECG